MKSELLTTLPALLTLLVLGLVGYFWPRPVLNGILIFMVAAIDAVPTFALGWWRFLERVGPNIEVEPLGIVSGLICIAAVVFVLHYFAAWLYSEIRVKQEHSDWPTAWRWRWTLCLLAAVVLLFAAGLIGVGLCRTTVWFFETPQIWMDRNRLI